MNQFEARVIKIDGYEVIEFLSENQSASIVVDIGNTLYHWIKDGQSIIYFPYSLKAYSESNKLAGNPLMYPWANRLDAEWLDFEEKRYDLDEKFLYKDGNGFPLHGLLLKAKDWYTKNYGADEKGAWHTAVYEFNESDELYETYPFKHRLEMTHRMDHRGISVHLEVFNESEKDLPISFGFHPYFDLRNSTREEVIVDLPFSDHVLTNKSLFPNGELEPSENLLLKNPFKLGKFLLDDGFVHREEGRFPSFSTEKYQLELEMEDAYRCCVVYAPLNEDKQYICIEPMLRPTNSFNSPIDGFAVPGIAPDTFVRIGFRMNVFVK